MDGFGFGRLAFLIAATVVALSSACSVSLAGNSPEVLRFCQVVAPSVGQDTANDVGRGASASAAEADADCIPRLSDNCDNRAVDSDEEATDNGRCGR